MMLYDNIFVQFNNLVPHLHELFLHYGTYFFYTLVTLSFTWFGIMLILYQRGIGDFGLGAIFVQIFQIGIGWTAWTFCDAWVLAILNSFQQIGGEAAGMTALDPSSIMDKAVGIFADMVAQLGFWGLFSHPGTIMTMSWASVLTFVCMALVALHMMFVLIWTQMLVALAPFMMSFMGSRWTHHFTDKYLSAVLHAGATILGLYIVVSMADGITKDWAEQIRARAGSDVGVLMEVFISSGIYFVIALMIPRMIGHMFSEGMSLTMAEIAATAAMVMRVSPRMAMASTTLAPSVTSTPSAGSSPAPTPAQAAQTLTANWSGRQSPAAASAPPAQTAAMVQQFRNAGQSPQPKSQASPQGGTGSQSSPPQVANQQVQSILNKWQQRGKP